MLFIGVINYSGDQLREIGLGSGDEARHLFYSHAKICTMLTSRPICRLKYKLCSY